MIIFNKLCSCTPAQHSPGRRWTLTVAALCFFAVSLSTPAVPSAKEDTHKSTPAEQQSVAVTIYNNNLGLVKDVRALSLPKGVQALQFEGVAARIDPTSVHIRSVRHPNDLSILEQNFEYDLISPAKLMEKYLGHTVELITVREEEEIVKKAKLIGIEGGYVYEMEGKIAVNPPGRVVMPTLPEGLISKPSLVWLLDNRRDTHVVEASYLTDGINWHSNYVLVLSEDDERIDMSGWVTIDNRCGTAFENASLKLVAGDVHRAPPERDGRPPMPMAERAVRVDKVGFEEEAFFEYHLYTLQRKTTLKNNQTKQISLLDAEGVSVKKTFVYSPLSRYYFSAMTSPDKGTKVGVFLDFTNSKDNNLGMPLPKGIVRVYKRDDEGALQFIGEDRIDHTPEDERIRVKMGEAFDVVAERVQTKFQILQSGHLYESAYKVTLRNHKDENIVVQVIEIIPGDWTILEKSHDYTAEASNRIRFDVPVGKKGETELTYSVRIKY